MRNWNRVIWSAMVIVAILLVGCSGSLAEEKGQFVGRDFDGKKRIHVTNPNHYIRIYKEE